jgi:hypothetical protein
MSALIIRTRSYWDGFAALWLLLPFVSLGTTSQRNAAPYQIMMNLPKSSSGLRPHQTAVLLAAGLSLIALVVPFLSRVLLPLTYLNTFFHELSHAVAATITGAQVDGMIVRSDGTGVTPALGGNLWLIGPAGYIGSAIIGAAILWFSRTEQGARMTLRVLAIVVAAGMMLWLRGDYVGVTASLGWLVAFVLASTFLRGMPLIFAAEFVGFQQCLNSITAVLTLVNITTSTESQSDALVMQSHTHIPAFFWAFGWCAISLVLVALSLRNAWKTPPKTRPESP